jgi:predicted membrane channel-forming protein YqfA (hemolysin III family)
MFNKLNINLTNSLNTLFILYRQFALMLCIGATGLFALTEKLTTGNITIANYIAIPYLITCSYTTIHSVLKEEH